MVKDYMNQLNGYINNDINTFSGGLNTYSDKAFIEQNQMPYVMNMAMYRPPMISTRAARETILENGVEADDVVAMWAYNDDLLFVITYSEGDSNATYFAYYHPKNPVDQQVISISSLLPPGKNFNFCYCRQATNEYLYVTTQSFKARVNIDINALPNQMVTNYTPITDGFYGTAAFHKGRLFFADESTNRITYSALYDFDNFTLFPDMDDQTMLSADVELVNGGTSTPSGVPGTTGAYNTSNYTIKLNNVVIAPQNTAFYFDGTNYVITFENGDRLEYKQNVWSTYSWFKETYDYSAYAGDFLVTNSKGKLTSIVSFDDKLVIFAEHSIHLLYGDTPLTTSSSQFQLVDMNNNLGCIAYKTIAIGGGYLYWLGDDDEIYSYSGAGIDTITKPRASRYVNRLGGISNIPLQASGFYEENLSVIVSEDTPNDSDDTPDPQFDEVVILKKAIAAATSNKYYIHFPIAYEPILPETARIASPIFVFDMSTQTWWAEDGHISAICNISYGTNKIMMARDKDIFITSKRYDGKDKLWNSEHTEIEEVPIPYEFHTKVYGVDGADSRKDISRVWIQATAEADVYLSDSWTATNYWTGPYLNNTLKKIGTLERRGRDAGIPNGVYMNQYDDNLYEQQECIVPKMYGQRLNAYQVVVKGTGPSKFYLMKREWGAR